MVESTYFSSNGNNNNSRSHVEADGAVESSHGGGGADHDEASLIIPIRNHPDDLFVEIFPEEMSSTPVSTLSQVLKDESADASTWADAGLLYMKQKLARESLQILEEACETLTFTPAEKAHHVRVLASAGIAHLAAQQGGGSGMSGSGGTASSGMNSKRGGGGGGGSGNAASDWKDDMRQQADQKFTQAGKVDTFFPMTWIGRGMLNLSIGRLDQARFFFQTTLKQCGAVMPALLGMAAVLYGEGDYKGAQQKYAEAIRKYPLQSGAATRVGFGLCSYKLGQVDRAKAAFARALAMDPENVQAMVGQAVLDMAGLDETSRDFSARTEKAIKMMSMANLLDHSNAMVQNHLANHYFWKWTPVVGTVEVTQGSVIVRGSQQIPLDPGERIRIGTRFETTVKEVLESNTNNDNGGDDDDEEENTVFKISDAWKDKSKKGLKVWKKDYDRVMALAKGAYGSTTVEKIQAESLFLLARVHHVQEDNENAFKLYNRACTWAPELSPARFGLAQTYIVKGDYENATKHLKQVLVESSTAVDALALLGLLEVKSGKSLEDGLAHLRKAIELDPLNADLVVLEALALQQYEIYYPKALERYKKAVDLMKRKGSAVPYEIYTNSGVLCHETKKYEESLEMYRHALAALDDNNSNSNSNTGAGAASNISIDNVGIEGGRLRHEDNHMFFGYIDSTLKLEQIVNEYVQEKENKSSDNAVATAATATVDDKSPSNDAPNADGEKPEGASADEPSKGNEDNVSDDKNKAEGNKDKDPESGQGTVDSKEGQEQVDSMDVDKENGNDKEPKERKLNKRLFKVVNMSDLDASSPFPVIVGDHIRLGETFVSEIVQIITKEEENGSTTCVIEIADDYNHVEPAEKDKNDEDDKKEDEMDVDGSGETTKKQPVMSMFVKRENDLLKNPAAITIAFNIARLHEATGRTLAAIEIHKAIVKRNPAYYNSYLRLACIAVDCGCLKECSEWLKIAAATAPGNNEVLTLIGNLHLSLCDWKPAQDVFDNLLSKKNSGVEAYASLSVGNIYFANLHVSEKRYAKHLQYAADFYKRMLAKDPANAYAANGLGTVLAEKGEIFKAKEAFNRVREVSGDNIADALLNLGHIYLAQKKHPEALQMYKSYMKRAEDGTNPITSKSRLDDVVDVLLYIAFAYFDWARHTELFNDANAAPADGRYKEAMNHLELAISKHSKKEVVLKYNLCMTKLQAANCALQKLTRNIPRTVEEVEEALKGLQEGHKQVEQILAEKASGKKVPIPSSTLQDFLKHCKANITSAESHLEDERKRAAEAEAEREIRRLAAEAAIKEEKLKEAIKREEELKKQEARDMRAEMKMRKVDQLRSGWQTEQVAEQEKEVRKGKKGGKSAAPEIEDEPGLEVVDDGHGFFHDSSDDESVGAKAAKKAAKAENKRKNVAAREKDLFGDSDEEEEANDIDAKKKRLEKLAKAKKDQLAASNKDLFGDSDEDDDDGAAKKKKSNASKKGNEATGENLFGDSDDEEGGGDASAKKRKAKSKPEKTPAASDTKEKPSSGGLFGDSDEEDEDNAPNKKQKTAEEGGKKADAKTPEGGETKETPKKVDEKELFGDSDEESDEELVKSTAKRSGEDVNDKEDDGQPQKKRRVLDEDDD